MYNGEVIFSMIGDKLRNERERQKLTIQDIAKGTSIRSVYIDAIEKGEYDKLPGKVYAKGFVRNYASFLRMDADAAVHQFSEENHPEDVAAAVETEERLQAAEERTRNEVRNKLATGSDFREHVSESNNRQNAWLIAVIVLLVAGGAYFLFAMDDGNTASKAPAKQVTQSAKKTTSSKPGEKKQEEPAVKVDGVELMAKFTDRCWTQVVADGKTVYEGTMEAGKSETWKGKSKVVITAGNAGAVELSVNGKSMGKAGDVGQVVEKSFTPDGQADAASSKADKKDSKK
jgi:cytoskeletal protein RodZ